MKFSQIFTLLDPPREEMKKRKTQKLYGKSLLTVSESLGVRFLDRYIYKLKVRFPITLSTQYQKPDSVALSSSDLETFLCPFWSNRGVGVGDLPLGRCFRDDTKHSSIYFNPRESKLRSLRKEFLC